MVQYADTWTVSDGVNEADNSVIPVNNEYLIEDQDCWDVWVLGQAFEHLKVKPAAHPSICHVHHDDHWKQLHLLALGSKHQKRINGSEEM